MTNGLQQWAAFYLTCAQVGVTAFALMFTAYQLNRDLWVNRDLGVISAAGSLFELISVTLVGLALGTQIRCLAVVVILAVGTFGLILSAVHVARHRRARSSGDGLTQKDLTEGHFIYLPFVSYGALMVSAVGMGVAADASWPLASTSAACIWLIFSGCSETFITLAPRLSVASDRMQRRPPTQEIPWTPECPEGDGRTDR